MPDEQKDKENDFAAMFAEYEQPGKKKKSMKEGDMVRGRIVSIGRDSAFIDLGGKTDGMIELAELRDADGNLTAKLGDEVEGRVVDTGDRSGCVMIRRTLGRGADAKGELEQAFAHGIPVEGTVSAVNKGGVEVQIAGTRAFCPASQLDLRHVEDPASYVGQKLTFRITRYESSGGRLNLVVSRRALLEVEAQANADELRKHLAVGSVVNGKVTAIKDFGAFVDLGGLEGLLHVSELGFQRVRHPSELLTIGQTIEVQIIKMEKADDASAKVGRDQAREKISLSLKSLERDPWSDLAGRLREGNSVAGKIVRLESFGAFVEIEPGIEGLMHISELAPEGKRLRHAKEAVKIGQLIDAVVLEVDADKRRIALGRGEKREPGDTPNASMSGGFATFADLLSKKK